MKIKYFSKLLHNDGLLSWKSENNNKWAINLTLGCCQTGKPCQTYFLPRPNYSLPFISDSTNLIWSNTYKSQSTQTLELRLPGHTYLLRFLPTSPPQIRSASSSPPLPPSSHLSPARSFRHPPSPQRGPPRCHGWRCRRQMRAPPRGHGWRRRRQQRAPPWGHRRRCAASNVLLPRRAKTRTQDDELSKRHHYHWLERWSRLAAPIRSDLDGAPSTPPSHPLPWVTRGLLLLLGPLRQASEMPGTAPRHRTSGPQLLLFPPLAVDWASSTVVVCSQIFLLSANIL